MPPSRRRAWLRDEVVLALDLYIREGVDPPASSVHEMSGLLRSISVEQELALDPSFRSDGAVKRKLANFLALESEGQAGLRHVSKIDAEVWDAFAADPAGLNEAARSIRATLLPA